MFFFEADLVTLRIRSISIIYSMYILFFISFDFSKLYFILTVFLTIAVGAGQTTRPALTLRTSDSTSTSTR